MKTIVAFIERHPLKLALGWMSWHWGLLLFGFLPYPQPRLAVLTAALVIDGLCAVTFFAWLFYRAWYPMPRKASQ